MLQHSNVRSPAKQHSWSEMIFFVKILFFLQKSHLQEFYLVIFRLNYCLFVDYFQPIFKIEL